MKRFLIVLGILLGTPALAQTTGVPYFPQVLPAGTIIGRSSVNPGPAEAIPFSRLLPLISAGSITFAGDVTAGNVTANTNLAVAGTSTLTGNVTMGGSLAATSFVTASNFAISNRLQVFTTADGVLLLTNYAASGLTSLALGPATSSYAMLAPTGSAGTLQIKLGDGSAFSPLETGAWTSKTSGGTVAHQFDVNGKQRVGATTAPALTSCGTSPTIVGNDHAATVTMGTGAPTGCVITFNVAYASTPICVGSWPAQALASQSYVVSTTAITLTQTGTSSNIFRYICLAQSGG